MGFSCLYYSAVEYLIVWYSDKCTSVVDQNLHTNFKISSGGEDIIFTNADGTEIDQVPAVDLESNVSYARQPDGIGSWLYFYTSTPGATNTGSGFSELMTPPNFSFSSGLYTTEFDLSLTHSNINAQIVYTLDGSEPSITNIGGTSYSYKNEYPLQPTDVPGPLLYDQYTSNMYASPIPIEDRSSDPDELTGKNPNQNILETPLNPVRKATVIKAKAYLNGVESETISHTYFVWSGGSPYDIPVISLQIQENYLFDYNDGV
ncbi:chitobiase/beta-hexosaminidase C-terminal domain-containing protein [Mesonia aestuariivivens]|uniref:Chitobiase/beta-hexosaminidase C-terminal domain-containing protein n=1 Tax=Mesonia aestuariivivens TaxID=2796128 RepID=A0ABS6VZJ7_9FLAO|nr:chitobiase/beta-hexosaminidase C-terminal domain-containing protein [Mesonia aestuariivivens]MBW2961020.1 chitobiase/beta-hexosaminidase C-terminal domain-containing protein [Mesonia aestuariivivens]